MSLGAFLFGVFALTYTLFSLSWTTWDFILSPAWDTIRPHVRRLIARVYLLDICPRCREYVNEFECGKCGRPELGHRERGLHDFTPDGCICFYPEEAEHNLGSLIPSDKLRNWR